MLSKAIQATNNVKDKFIDAFIEMKGEHIAELLPQDQVVTIDFSSMGEKFCAKFFVVIGDFRLAAQVLSDSPFVAIAKAADEIRDKILSTLYEHNSYA